MTLSNWLAISGEHLVAVYGSRRLHTLLQHQNRIKRTLDDFVANRGTEHLSHDEIDRVIAALQKRLEGIKADIAALG